MHRFPLTQEILKANTWRPCWHTKQWRVINILLFKVHQHGGHDVTRKRCIVCVTKIFKAPNYKRVVSLPPHHTCIKCSPGGPLTYFTDGGPRDFLRLKFWPKGIFRDYERRRDFLDHDKNTGILFGYCTFYQHKSTIT